MNFPHCFSKPVRNGLLLLLGLLVSSIGWAGTRVELIDPEFIGNGCPQGSSQVTLSHDAKRINFTFEKFFVESGHYLENSSANKECKVAIRVKVPHGFSVAIHKVEYNGIKELPYGANAHVTGAHYFNHEQILSVNKRYYGQTSSAFDITKQISVNSLYWAPCGEEVVISSHTRVSITASKSVKPASLRVDDPESEAGLSYHLIWRACSNQFN